MMMIATGLIWVVGVLAILGIFALLSWWLRYCIAVMYMLMPVMMVFWFFWAWVVAIPVGLISDGGPVDQKVMAISHWLSDANWTLIKFCFTFPFKLFIWAADGSTWIMKFFGA
jgi:hypothetical protein